MNWSDSAIILSLRPFGETGSIVTVLSREQGRYAGLARGQRLRAQLQPGVRVSAEWRARLEEHLGAFRLEPGANPAAAVLDDPLRLAALSAACALVERALPERAPYPAVYDGLEALLALLPETHWDAAYVQFEIGLLAAMGFGLDLTRCAATGVNDMLAYVSPRTGRAVSLSAAEPWRDRLLPLPGFLIGKGDATPTEIAAGLALTGHFLDRNLFGQGHARAPAARLRYVEAYRRMAASSKSDAP